MSHTKKFNKSCKSVFTKAQIKQNIKADLYRLYPEKFSPSILLKGLKSKGFKYMFFKRLSLHSNFIVRYFSRFMSRILSYRYGFQIYRTTSIGGGFYIGHFGTLVISDIAIIGKNCNIGHNCTIGKTRGKKGGAPKLGDKIWMGTGCVIVGDITIGSDVLIAPNAYVNFNVPSHSIVLGNPGRIIPKKNPTQNYINNAWTG